MCASLSLRAINKEAVESFNQHLKNIPHAPNCQLYLTAPPHLMLYINELLYDAIRNPGFKVFDIKNINEENKNFQSVAIISAGDPESLDDICCRFSRCKNVYKSLLIMPKFNENAKIMLKNYNLNPVFSPVNESRKETDIYIGEISSDFLAIEDDFFLLPYRNSFKRIFINHDFSELYTCARALTKIQYMYGRIPEVFTIGESSEKIGRLMHGMLDHNEVEEKNSTKIHACIIIDRLADMYTPLSLMQTVEQLINERIGIDCGYIKLKQWKGHKRFRDKDPCFKEYRGMNLIKGNQFFTDKKNEFDEYKRKSEELNEELKAAKEPEKIQVSAKLEEVKQKLMIFPVEHMEIFNELLDSLKSHELYFDMCNMEMDLIAREKDPLLYIEHLISIYGDWQSALRVLCLRSLCNFSLKESVLLQIQKEIIAEFSEKAMEGIFNLEKLNLMSTEKFPWNFSAIKKALNLFDFNEEDPMRSPMNGFIPCAVQLTRIIGKAIQNHTKESSEDSAEKKARDAFSSSQFNITVDGKKAILEENEKCRILVFFVGGVTLTEVGMLKQLTDIDAIIGGTESVHGNGLIGQICPFLPK